MTSTDDVQIDWKAALQMARDLNVAVVSLDRLGSAYAGRDRADLADALLRLHDDFALYEKLARARRVAVDALMAGAGSLEEELELEDEIGGGPYWSAGDGSAS